MDPICKKKKKKKTLCFEQAKFVNAKLYWKMLKESANLKSFSDVDLSTFERYFKAINNPSDPFFYTGRRCCIF